MKNKFIHLLLFAGILSAQSAFSENVKTEEAKVSNATVFLRGAQLTCNSDFVALPGINQFIFEGVSPNLDPNSLQASAKGNVTIMDVKYQIRYNEIPPKENPNQIDRTLKMVNDSLVMLNFEIEEMNEQLQSFTTEKNILLNNRLMKGESLRDTLDMFKEGIAFLRMRLADISNESMLLKKRLYFKNNSKQALEKRIQDLNKINQAGRAPVKESVPTIVVMVYAELQSNTKISVSFFVDRAAWLPTYDLRANSDGSIDLNYKAELRQQTGMDWKNVTLTLSTGNPALSTQKPILNPFYLSFANSYNKRIQNESRELLSKIPSLLGASSATEEQKDEIMLDAPTLAAYTDQREGMIQTEYNIKLKYNIPHDDDMHVVSIQQKSLKGKYQYSAVPKLDMNAFLIAELVDLTELNLIPGNSRIYMDGSFVGRGVLNPDAFKDTINLSFGKDRSIVVNRKRLKDKTKERILVDEKTISTTYEITIKNNKAGTVNIDLTDQIPVSQDPNIKIALIDGDGSELNDETGLLSWKLNLKSMESKTIRFSYEVKLPKSKSLAGL
ncbi:MAG: mucoidy inhibitor MuiA family protein [Bacteroidetes bacterium]|nr:MAG: mucoidy inhibitor MuiA family protein [Bacteroidota bacterium]